MRRKLMMVAVTLGIVLTLAVAVLYLFVLPGLSTARRGPPAVETVIATWLLRHSVPPDLAARTNPLSASEADIAAGATLFWQKCEVCNAYGGSAHTQIGTGEYPRPPALRGIAGLLTDGEILYHIRNGIRNTGMPASMPTTLASNATRRGDRRAIRSGASTTTGRWASTWG